MVDLSNQLLASVSRKDRNPARTALVVLAYLLAAFTIGLSLSLHRAWPVQWLPAIATASTSLFALVLTRFHLRHTPVETTTSANAERIIWSVALLCILGTQLLTNILGQRELLGMGFLLTAPLVAQGMLTSALLGPPLAMFSLTVVSFLLGISGAAGIELLAASWLAGAVGAHAVNPLKQRGDLMRALGVQVSAQFVVAIAISAALAGSAMKVFESAGWAAMAAVGATALFWLAATLLERVFHITSDWSLLELCSPEHPLLRRLTQSAPGTFAHSVNVGNLAENAAREIGANPVHCRAMAYFHDIGKLTRPSYFIENQFGHNVHDDLPPSLSARVIAAHVSDGLELARQFHLPKVIVDGIAEHHGTTLITYFYNRAKALMGDEPDDPNFDLAYRYPGPRPQTRESAILHLADSIEAVSRTVARGGAEDLETVVSKIIEDRRADGQLDECDLTFRDLQLIKHSFLRTLGAIRHERISYAKDKLDEALAQASDTRLEHLPTPPSSEAYTPRP